MTKIKEKIGLYKILITLSWTACFLSISGAYKVFHTGEKAFLYACSLAVFSLGLGTIFLIKRTRHWINKLEK